VRLGQGGAPGPVASLARLDTADSAGPRLEPEGQLRLDEPVSRSHPQGDLVNRAAPQPSDSRTRSRPGGRSSPARSVQATAPIRRTPGAGTPGARPRRRRQCSRQHRRGGPHVGAGRAAILVREGIDPILHVTCRDRNRLALQSDLLGAAALGIRNVLCLTGDHVITAIIPRHGPYSISIRCSFWDSRIT